MLYRPRFLVSRRRQTEFDYDVNGGVDMHGVFQSGLVGITLRDVHTRVSTELASDFRARLEYPNDDMFLVEETQAPKGARVVYACVEHEDCREHPEVGVACWAQRQGKRP